MKSDLIMFINCKLYLIYKKSTLICVTITLMRNIASQQNLRQKCFVITLILLVSISCLYNDQWAAWMCFVNCHVMLNLQYDWPVRNNPSIRRESSHISRLSSVLLLFPVVPETRLELEYILLKKSAISFAHPTSH